MSFNGWGAGNSGAGLSRADGYFDSSGNLLVNDITGRSLTLKSTGSLTNAILINKTSGTLTNGINIRDTLTGDYIQLGTASDAIYRFSSGNQVGALFQSSLSFLAPVGATAQVSTASTSVLKYTAANRLNPQIGTDGYSFHDIEQSITKVKLVDQTVSTTVLADDADINFGTLDANALYAISASIKCTNTAGAEGLKFDLAGTVGLTSLNWNVIMSAGGVFSSQELTTLGSGGFGVTTSNASIMVHGHIRTSTAGTLKMQIAQAAHSSGSTVFKAGSWMSIRKL